MPQIKPYPNKIWQQNETIERYEMNDISSTLYEITSDYNDFFTQFTSADDTQTAAARIKNYIDSFTCHTSFADDDGLVSSINDNTASFGSIGSYYDSISSNEDGIIALEKKCERIEKFITSIGERVVSMGNGSAGMVSVASTYASNASQSANDARNWAISTTLVDEEDYSAKYYADLAKDWAISTAEIEQVSSGNYSAKYYADYIKEEATKIDNLYWTGNKNQSHTITLENCIIPGISADGGKYLIFNVNLGKNIDQNFTAINSDVSADFYGLKTARDLSIDITTTEIINETAVPLTQIRLYGKNTWLLNYTNGYNKLDATDGYWGSNKGIAPAPITHKIITNNSLPSTITLILTNNNLSKCTNAKKKTTYSSAGWGIPYTSNAKSTGGRIGGSVPVLMFVKKLLVKYTPYIDPNESITSGTTTTIGTEPAAGTGNNNNP